MRAHASKEVLFEGKFGDMSFLSEFAQHIEEISVTNEVPILFGIGMLGFFLSRFWS